MRPGRGGAEELPIHKLDISLNTVRTYIRRIYKKLHVNSRHAAVERFKKMR
jgi:DNA-binding CsgD family transcriptional regulator